MKLFKVFQGITMNSIKIVSDVRVSMHKHNFSIAILHKVLNKYERNGIQIMHSLNFDRCFCEPASDHVTQYDKD
jgi:transcriptional regulator